MRRRKKPRPFTWIEKTMIEHALEFATLHANREGDAEFEGDFFLKGFQKALAVFRKKTKFIKKPRQRRKRKKSIALRTE